MRNVKSVLLKLMALAMALMLLPVAASAEEAAAASDWVSFLLICNEGMNNTQGNAGNTLMLVAMNPNTGKIRLASFTWDTFVDYEGYDVPQKLDMPYRNNGPEEAMKVFNANFGTELTHYMSLNFLNLANLIDSYGGVTVDVTRAERNALNGMVASKSQALKAQAASGLLDQILIDKLAAEYQLEEYGPETHLNGLQAVGYGWLQYDSVYNCCERDVEVISSLFGSVAATISEEVVFYTNAYGAPEETDGRRAVNLDALTEDDMKFLRKTIAPIFDMSANNLQEEEIESISLALAKVAYEAARQGVNIFVSLEHTVMPLEAQNEYDIIAGTKGHLVDKEANAKAIVDFLYKE